MAPRLRRRWVPVPRREGDEHPGPPLLSVVIPVFNGASFVGDAIASALAGGDGVEVVVVDDGSTDATPAVLEAVDDPGLRVVSAGHGGVSNARNVGARLARAPLIVFLDADDVLLPGWCEAVITAHRCEQAQVVCWPVLWRTWRKVRRGHAPRLTPWDVAGFLAGAFSMTVALFEQLGGYDSALGYAESTELSMRLRDWLKGHDGGLVILDQPFCERAVQGSPADRDLAYAERRLVATQRIVDRHGTTLLAGSHVVGLYLGIGGAAAARLRRWGTARQLFAGSIRRRRGRPSLRSVGRLAAASVPGVRGLVWRR